MSTDGCLQSLDDKSTSPSNAIDQMISISIFDYFEIQKQELKNGRIHLSSKFIVRKRRIGLRK